MASSNVTRERVGALMRNLSEILADSPEGLQARDAIEKLRERIPPTEYESASFGSGGERYPRIVRFATIDLSKAGWLTKEGGIWSLTDAGRLALEQYRDGKSFYLEAVRLYRDWARDNAAADNDRAAAVEPFEVDSQITTSQLVLDEVREQADQAILAHLSEMDAYAFQQLVADLLQAMGHHIDFFARPGKDGGIDIVAYSDAVGADGRPRIKVQVKGRSGTKADVKELREFSSLLHSSDVGIFVSLAGFTSDGEREMRGVHDKRLILIDFRRLMDLWIENYGQLAESARKKLPLTTVSFLDL